MKIKIIIALFAISIVATYFGAKATSDYLVKLEIKKENEERLALENNVKENLSNSFSKTKSLKEAIWPSKHVEDNKNYDIEYTFNKKLSLYVKRILKRYRSDYSAVIVIDNETGKLLSAIGYERTGNKFNVSLPFSTTHPSASLFKIITSAALLESKKVSNSTIFNYRGRGTTLYKYQLLDKKTRWTRYLDLKKAFAFSNNVIFGKAAIDNIRGEDLYNQAIDFGFNSNIMDELSLSKSIIRLPRSQYNLAEIASGFNKDTMISPLHGAIMASVVANGGVIKKPYLVEKLINQANGENVWQHRSSEKRILSTETTVQLSELMEGTVKRGTARGSFRRLRSKLKKELRIGGKTGSITGGLPYGKRDWFTAYAVPKNEEYGKGISICVMNVNVNKWYVKSTFLVKSIIEYYYKEAFHKNGAKNTQFVSNKDVRNKLKI